MSAITQQLIVGMVFLLALSTMVKNLISNTIEDRPQINWNTHHKRNNQKTR